MLSEIAYELQNHVVPPKIVHLFFEFDLSYQKMSFLYWANDLIHPVLVYYDSMIL